MMSMLEGSWINPFKGERQELVVYLPATSQLIERMICMLPAEAFGGTVYKTFCHDRLESDLRKVKLCDKITNLKVKQEDERTNIVKRGSNH